MATAAPPAPAGPAHVAVVSFLASRAAPTGGFWIALAGGTAIAHVAQRRGARPGFGASVAAMLETVAIIGPARFGIPLTQAITAPLLGRLEARGSGVMSQLLACAAVRLLHASATAFFIWVVTGGLDAYAGTYDALGRRLSVEIGTADALLLTGAGLIGWAIFASTVQVLVYRRGLRGWDEAAGATEVPRPAASGERAPGRRARITRRRAPLRSPRGHGRGGDRLRPSAVEYGVAPARGRRPRLGLAWALSRPDAAPLPAGLAFAALLASGAFAFALGAASGSMWPSAARRAPRSSCSWPPGGGRRGRPAEVFRRSLGRLRRLPSVPEAAQVLDEIASEGRLAAAGRSLTAELSAVRKRPLPLLDAVLVWVAREATAFRGAPPPPAPAMLRARALDIALVALAVARPSP